MKLTKNRLIRLTKGSLKDVGYTEVKDTLTGAQGLYIKSIDENLFLTLGLTISRYYDNMFTASFYLSKVTSWGAIWGDIPKNSYERVGTFLTNEEKRFYLDAQYHKDGVRDSWWDEENQEAISHFIKTIIITEDRFINQIDLIQDIKKSVDVNELKELATATIHLFKSSYTGKYSYQHIPKKPIDDIPLEWFKAAERAIVDIGGILNINTVKRLAADAYRQELIRNG